MDDLIYTPDPYDAGTPYLSFDEVRELVAQLPDEVLVNLSKGPLPGDDNCRLCRALRPIMPVHPSEPVEAQGELAIVAQTLHDWHDNIGRSAFFGSIIEPKLFPGELKRAQEEEDHIWGLLMYARCSLVYALAGVERSRREVKRLPIAELLRRMVEETQEGDADPVKQAAAAGVDMGELAHAITEERLLAVISNYESMGPDGLLGGLGEAFVAGVTWGRGG